MAVMEKLKSFLAKCGRVWHVLRKPSMSEFSSISKISAIGILIIGFIGFVINAIMTLF